MQNTLKYVQGWKKMLVEIGVKACAPGVMVLQRESERQRTIREENGDWTET